MSLVAPISIPPWSIYNPLSVAYQYPGPCCRLMAYPRVSVASRMPKTSHHQTPSLMRLVTPRHSLPEPNYFSRIADARQWQIGADTEASPSHVSRLSLIHISEPTRLGMISYAVFCLKKK